MSRHLLIVVLASSAISAAGGQMAPPVRMTQDEANIITLTRLEDALASALVRRDRAAFERMLAPRFVYSEDGRTLSRADYLRLTRARGDTIIEARTDSLEIHVFGSTGVVTGWLIMTGRGAAGPFHRRHRFTDVWVPRSGSWQLVAGHAHRAGP